MTRFLVLFAAALAIGTAAEAVKIRNNRVTVYEDTMAPGQSQMIRGELPSVLVFTDTGAIGRGAAFAPVHPGDVQYAPPGQFTIKNVGKAPLGIVRVEFAGKGLVETWGNRGIPQYKLILENPIARVYEIKVK